MPADLIIYAVVAAGLVLWLRNILGTKSGDERQRPNPFAARPENPAGSQKAPSALPATPALLADQTGGRDMKAGLARNMEIAHESAETGLSAIAQADTDFETARFLRGAQDAFVMIVEAFAEGDKATLKDLLAPEVYTTFASAIDDRRARGESAHVEIHAVRRLTVLEAGLRQRIASVTVKIIADETNILRDAANTVIHGHPDRVTETIDIWTFTRDIRSRDPSWLLAATRDEDAAGQDTKTVPDSL